MRAVPFPISNRGMTRLRDKGGASPTTLFELTNAYIDIDGTARPRPGTDVFALLPAGTKGLISHNGKLHVFSAVPIESTDPKIVINTLRHPTIDGTPLLQIHFASPFMGFLYVAAEFSDGLIQHYWVEALGNWEAGTSVRLGQRVSPSDANGYVYKVVRLGGIKPKWAPGVERTVGDEIEPTSQNGFRYEVVSTTGANPASGDVEPNWPAENGALIVERTSGNEDPVSIPSEFVDDTDDSEIPIRYIGIAGGGASGSIDEIEP